MVVTAIVVSVLLLIACLCLGYLAARRVRLMRGGGVDVCLRRRMGSSRSGSLDAAGWHFGVGRYRGDQLVWFRLTSFRPRASVVLDRTELDIVNRRPPTAAETYEMPHAASVLVCRVRGSELELAMAPGVLMGFLSWLESAAPGRSTGYRQAS